MGARQESAIVNPRRRFSDAQRSFEMILHLAGERESSATRICYSPAPVEKPHRETLRYGQAAQVIERARTRDPRFRQTIDAAVLAWSELRNQPAV